MAAALIKEHNFIQRLRTRLARALMPGQVTPAAAASKRLYGGAQVGRLTNDWLAPITSGDAELYTSLRLLRGRSRQLVRDNDYAKNAIRAVRNNIIGQGIPFQAQAMMRRGKKLDEVSNDAIEAAYKRWSRADSCDVTGKCNLDELDRMLVASIAESGEVLVRKIRQPFGRNNKIPLALEVIESDQLVDNLTGRSNDGNEIRMGVEMDQWHRPIAYWFYPRHPGDAMFGGTPASSRYERVPANEVYHLGIAERLGQTRYVPWLHSAMLKLNHMRGYEEAEIVAARASANVMGFIQSPEIDLPGVPGAAADAVQDGQRVMDLDPGTVKNLGPGETFMGFNPTRPNGAMEPFMRYMLRSVSAGIGMSYETLSRDYSQSNYSSSRLSLLEDRENWRILQQWYISAFKQPLFEEWLDLANLSGAINLPNYELERDRYQAVRWMPRGWGWVDPLKEVMAAKLSVRAGFETMADIISEAGGDYEDKFKQRRRELDLAADYALVLETDPAQTNDKGDVQPLAAPAEADTGLDADGDPLPGGTLPAAAAAADAATQKTQKTLERLRNRQDRLALAYLALDDQIEAVQAS